jgi:FkbM family methyltransferase
MKKVLRKILKSKGYSAIQTRNLEELYYAANVRDAVSRWTHSCVPPELAVYILKKLIATRSSSQLQQELLALFVSELSREPEPYFVEFGACDGLIYSNTYALERIYGWSGLLAEPAIAYQDALRINRKSEIETRCIWGSSGEFISFREEPEGEYSSVVGNSSNLYSKSESVSYEVETISLMDTLMSHNAPQKINFLSIDTEGSEWEIIKRFDFSQYEFSFLSIEHNFSENRNKVFHRLTANGYYRVLKDISAFDDWFLHSSIIKKISKNYKSWDLKIEG